MRLGDGRDQTIETDGGAGRSDAPRRRAAVTFAARLSFDRVSRRYGKKNALDGFSLDVAPGEVVCLLGPSGCGKTTLLRVTSGIEKVSGGRVLINDYEVSGPERFVPPERRGVGLMFQDFALFPHLTVLDNVAFGLKGLPREDAHREACAILSRVGLLNHANVYPGTLSGGQQQRVALARAIVPRPSVMLMDEPFSGLDVQLRDSMQEEILAILRETRATSVIVTHHPEEAMRLGDRIAVMRAGRLVQVGTAEDLYRHPADLFVARLFSEINEVPYTVRDRRICTPIGSFDAPGIEDGARAVLCLRERGAELSSSGEGLLGRVTDKKFLGDIVLLELGVTGFEQSLRVRVLDRQQWQIADEVKVQIDPQKVLVFREEALEEG